MVSRFTWAGSGITKAKKQNNQKKRFISHSLNFLLALLLNQTHEHLVVEVRRVIAEKDQAMAEKYQAIAQKNLAIVGL